MVLELILQSFGRLYLFILSRVFACRICTLCNRLHPQYSVDVFQTLHTSFGSGNCGVSMEMKFILTKLIHDLLNLVFWATFFMIFCCRFRRTYAETFTQ